MKLDEAMKLMLEGKTMVDASGFIYRLNPYRTGFVELQMNNMVDVLPHSYRWTTEKPYFEVDGWREATERELKAVNP